MDTPAPHSHMPEYLAEFLGTAFMVFFGLSAVVFDFSPNLPMVHWIPDLSTRRLITGLCFAATGSIFAITPLGRLSGAHINPSVSLAFWLHGKMKLHDFIGYILAQVAGAVFGETLLVAFWKKDAESIQNGMTQVGTGWTVLQAFSAEVGITALLIAAIFIFVSSEKLMRWTPLMTWLLVALMVWQEAPISGTSLNPARSLAPALVTGLWQNQWIYWIAPPLGAALGWVVFVLARTPQSCVLTAKLFHASRYRSIFRKEVRPAVATPAEAAEGG